MALSRSRNTFPGSSSRGHRQRRVSGSPRRVSIHDGLFTKRSASLPGARRRSRADINIGVESKRAHVQVTRTGHTGRLIHRPFGDWLAGWPQICLGLPDSPAELLSTRFFLPLCLISSLCAAFHLLHMATTRRSLRRGLTRLRGEQSLPTRAQCGVTSVLA